MKALALALLAWCCLSLAAAGAWALLRHWWHG